jgi:hypothetical protein
MTDAEVVLQMLALLRLTHSRDDSMRGRIVLAVEKSTDPYRELVKILETTLGFLDDELRHNRDFESYIDEIETAIQFGDIITAGFEPLPRGLDVQGGDSGADDR